MTEIRLEHVSYAYGDEKILEDINLQVASGEVVSCSGYHVSSSTFWIKKYRP